jgi:hypothetical protein
MLLLLLCILLLLCKLLAAARPFWTEAKYSSLHWDEPTSRGRESADNESGDDGSGVCGVRAGQ